MTKRDYQMVAARLNRERSNFMLSAAQPISRAGQRLLENYAHGVECTTRALVDEFEKADPRFDRDRFLIGAGVPR